MWPPAPPLRPPGSVRASGISLKHRHATFDLILSSLFNLKMSSDLSAGQVASFRMDAPAIAALDVQCRSASSIPFACSAMLDLNDALYAHVTCASRRPQRLNANQADLNKAVKR